MERIRDGDGRSLAVSTKEMREVCREAHRRELNRQVTPAQFRLLDPRGVHVLVPQFMHDRADGKRVEPHLRCYSYLKLIGKQKATEKQLDIPMQFVSKHITDDTLEEMKDKGRAFKAYEDDDNDDDFTESISDVLDNTEGNV